MVGLKRIAIIASLLCVGLSSCASDFPYRSYGLDADDYGGQLLGPSPTDDLPLSRCKPDEFQKGKCRVMFTDEFLMLRVKYMDLEARLKECETR